MLDREDLEGLRLLLEAGADPNETNQRGQTEIAGLLAARGANTQLTEIDRFLGLCAAADPAQLDGLLAAAPRITGTPENELLLIDLANSHRTIAVQALLAAGMPLDACDEPGATALHWACWKGYADLVKLLLDRGAPLNVEDSQFHATPAGWFVHGRQNCGEPGGDYPRVARLLRAAGASIPGQDPPAGDDE